MFAQLSQDLSALHAIANSDLSSSAIGSQAIEDLHTTLSHPDLYQAFIESCQEMLDDDKNDPFQQFIAACFFDRHESAYLPGSSRENDDADIDLTFLNTDVAFLSERQAADLINQITLTDADVVYTPKAFIDEAHQLYEVLQDNYTHFIFVPCKPVSDLLGHPSEKGYLIASKDSFEQARFALDILEGFQESLIILPVKSRKSDKDPSYSAEVGIRRKWGGQNKDEPKWDVYGKGNVRDGKGNYAGAEVKQNDKGEGSAEVRAGCESKKKQ